MTRTFDASSSPSTANPSEDESSFFELRRDAAAPLALSLADVCGAIVRALLDAKPRQLARWAAKREPAAASAQQQFQRRMAAAAAAGGEPAGFDERFALMLAELLPLVAGADAHRTRTLLAHFAERDARLSAAAQLVHGRLMIGGLAAARDLQALRRDNVCAIVALGG